MDFASPSQAPGEGPSLNPPSRLAPLRGAARFGGSQTVAAAAWKSAADKRPCAAKAFFSMGWAVSTSCFSPSPAAEARATQKASTPIMPLITAARAASSFDIEISQGDLQVSGEATTLPFRMNPYKTWLGIWAKFGISWPSADLKLYRESRRYSSLRMNRVPGTSQNGKVVRCAELECLLLTGEFVYTAIEAKAKGKSFLSRIVDVRQHAQLPQDEREKFAQDGHTGEFFLAQWCSVVGDDDKEFPTSSMKLMAAVEAERATASVTRRGVPCSRRWH